MATGAPSSPRDVATGYVVVGDPSEDVATVTFKDMNGNAITTLSDLEGNQFIVEVNYNKHYLGSSFTVNLTSDDGDVLQVTVNQE